MPSYWPKCFIGRFIKESACNAEDASSIPEPGRSPGGGNGNRLQYSCLGNPLNRGTWHIVHGVTKNWTWLSTWWIDRWIYIHIQLNRDNLVGQPPNFNIQVLQYHLKSDLSGMFNINIGDCMDKKCPLYKNSVLKKLILPCRRPNAETSWLFERILEVSEKELFLMLCVF